jgi:hypothetical protein
MNYAFAEPGVDYDLGAHGPTRCATQPADGKEKPIRPGATYLRWTATRQEQPLRIEPYRAWDAGPWRRFRQRSPPQSHDCVSVVERSDDFTQQMRLPAPPRPAEVISRRLSVSTLKNLFPISDAERCFLQPVFWSFL